MTVSSSSFAGLAQALELYHHRRSPSKKVRRTPGAQRHSTIYFLSSSVSSCRSREENDTCKVIPGALTIVGWNELLAADGRDVKVPEGGSQERRASEIGSKGRPVVELAVPIEVVADGDVEESAGVECEEPSTTEMKREMAVAEHMPRNRRLWESFEVRP